MEYQDFSGSLEDWERQTFLAANQFRLHRFAGVSTLREEAEVASFPEAMMLVLASVREGYSRFLVYAITAAGRHFAIPQDRWPHYADLWCEKHLSKGA